MAVTNFGLEYWQDLEWNHWQGFRVERVAGLGGICTLYRLLEDPTTFDVVLARFPARKPTLLHRIATLFRRRPHD